MAEPRTPKNKGKGKPLGEPKAPSSTRKKSVVAQFLKDRLAEAKGTTLSMEKTYNPHYTAPPPTTSNPSPLATGIKNAAVKTKDFVNENVINSKPEQLKVLERQMAERKKRAATPIPTEAPTGDYQVGNQTFTPDPAQLPEAPGSMNIATFKSQLDRGSKGDGPRVDMPTPSASATGPSRTLPSIFNPTFGNSDFGTGGIDMSKPSVDLSKPAPSSSPTSTEATPPAQPGTTPPQGGQPAVSSSPTTPTTPSGGGPAATPAPAQPALGSDALRGYRTNRVHHRDTGLDYLRTPQETMARIRDGRMALALSKNTDPSAGAQAVAARKAERQQQAMSSANRASGATGTGFFIQNQSGGLTRYQGRKNTMKKLRQAS